MRTMVNLLPSSFLRRQMLRKRVVQWMVVMCVVFAGSWAWHWYEVREQNELLQQLAVLTREHQPTQSMLKQLVQMRHRLNSIQQQERIARELEEQRNALTLLGAISTAARETNGRLRLTKLEVTDFQKPSVRVEAGTPDTQMSGVLVTGVSLDNAAVAELLDGLHESGLFSRVELVTMTERESGSAGLRDYQVRCEF